MYTRNHHLNGPHKKRLVGKQFATDANKKQAVTSCLQMLGTVFFFVYRDTSLGAMVGQMFICQQQLCRGLMCIISHLHVMHALNAQ